MISAYMMFYVFVFIVFWQRVVGFGCEIVLVLC
jgi:hypothetical protein